MSRKIDRRNFLAGTAAAASAASFPMPAVAQNTPIKVGLLTVKTDRCRRAACTPRKASLPS